MNELSKERLENYASGSWYPDADYVKAMARELLALREVRERAEPVSDDELNAALSIHRLNVEGHSQLSDAFRAGFKYARRTAPRAPVELTVWYGAMPESNGKTNWTAILHRKGEPLFNGITIECSEYSDRVRYEADRMRYLIGELAERPCILNYDADKHSGYVAPQPAPVDMLTAVLRNAPLAPSDNQGQKRAEPYGYVYSSKDGGAVNFGYKLPLMPERWDIVPVFDHAPPAPAVVPDEVTAEDCPYGGWECDKAEAWARGWNDRNACRTGMLTSKEAK